MALGLKWGKSHSRGLLQGVGWLAGWLAGCLLGWLTGWLVGVGRQLARFGADLFLLPGACALFLGVGMKATLNRQKASRVPQSRGTAGS